MKYEHLRHTLAARYREMETAVGVDVSGLGLMGALGLEKLSHGPMPQVRAGNDGKARFKAPLEVMGMLIKTGMARFVPEEKSYAITERGESRLKTLVKLGLIHEAKKIQAKLEAAKKGEGVAA